MRTSTLLGTMAAGFLAASAPAFAQTTNAAATSSTSAGSYSGSQIDQTFESGNTPATETVNDNLRNTPDVLMPALPGSANVCSNAASAGAAGMGFGVALGGSWDNPHCERRAFAAELYEMHHQAAAVALLCQEKSVAKAMAAVGTPCPTNDPPAHLTAVSAAAIVPTCHQIFIAPADPNGAGYLKEECH